MNRSRAYRPGHRRLLEGEDAGFTKELPFTQWGSQALTTFGKGRTVGKGESDVSALGKVNRKLHVVVRWEVRNVREIRNAREVRNLREIRNLLEQAIIRRWEFRSMRPALLQASQGLLCPTLMIQCYNTPASDLSSRPFEPSICQASVKNRSRRHAIVFR